MTKVAVALSGGIDSSVTAALLLEKGYEVVGITGKMFSDEHSEEIIKNAKKVADNLGIEHYILDLSSEFSKYVINYFETSYKEGKTPNPCIMCNKHIKWGTLFDYAIKELNVDFIATGHYANIKFEDGFYKLYPAIDEKKDQLYFLFQLSQEQLSKTLFPLSEYKKIEVKLLAEKYNLPTKSSKESQDICFITKPLTTKKYITEKFGPQKGDFIFIKNGKKLGTHDGFYQYTIGQRKGIGIAYEEPLYVVKLDSDNNIVYVGTKEDLSSNILNFYDLKLQYPIQESEFRANIKIRYNMEAQTGTVQIDKENNTGSIIFDIPVTAITSGQAVVFYDIKDSHLLGGGWIE